MFDLSILLGKKTDMSFAIYSVSEHRWFSGRMLACHAGGPGSIPGRCRRTFAFTVILMSHPYAQKSAFHVVDWWWMHEGRWVLSRVYWHSLLALDIGVNFQ